MQVRTAHNDCTMTFAVLVFVGFLGLGLAVFMMSRRQPGLAERLSASGYPWGFAGGVAGLLIPVVKDVASWQVLAILMLAMAGCIGRAHRMERAWKARTAGDGEPRGAA